MSSFCTCNEIDLELLDSTVANDVKFRRYGSSVSIVRYADALHCRFRDEEAGVRDAFIFPYGVSVLWAFSPQQELGWLRDIESACDSMTVPGFEVNQSAAVADSDYMLFRDHDSSGSTSSGGRSIARVGNDTIDLITSDPVERLAISFAFAQSTRLSVFERALDLITEDCRQIPEELAISGRSRIRPNDVARLTGKVFLARTAVNLFSNILDTPQFFWDAERFEPLYQRGKSYLDTDDRVQILNSRLDIVNDLLDNLNEQLTFRSSERLEIIIIFLIALEILIGPGSSQCLRAVDFMKNTIPRLLLVR